MVNNNNNLWVKNGNYIAAQTVGNVGIGTSNPITSLHIVDNEYQAQKIESSNSVRAGLNLTSPGNANYTLLATGAGAGSGAGKFGVFNESSGIFTIQTDKPNTKVSWQVTGIRQDEWANKNRVIPEIEKETNNKGKYLYPNLFGKSLQSQIKSY
jgi:hypothetical protein